MFIVFLLRNDVSQPGWQRSINIIYSNIKLTLVKDISCLLWIVGNIAIYFIVWPAKIVSEYDQEIPQSQTADKPMAPRGIATQPSRDTRIGQTKQSNQLSLPHQHTGHFLYQPPVTCRSMYPLTWFKRPDDDTVLVDCIILPARKKPIRRKIYLWRRASHRSRYDRFHPVIRSEQH